MTTKAEREQEQTDAIAKLREWFPPRRWIPEGGRPRIATIVVNVAASGMSRSIKALAVVPGDDGRITDISYWVARALDRKIDSKRGGVICRGCGMDMTFELVYSLSKTLYSDGYYMTRDSL